MGFALKPSCWNKWHSVATAARSMSCTKTQTTSGTNSASDQLYGHSFDPTALTEEHWLLIMRRRGLSGRKKVRINCQALPYWAPPYRALDHCLQSHRQEREEQLVAKLLGCSQPAKKNIAFHGCLSCTYASLNPCFLFLLVNASNSFASQHPPLLRSFPGYVSEMGFKNFTGVYNRCFA